ncbi:MAG: Lrp/AsnC family transcriptional regulator [Clostridia bacterium]|nr:Lrp/AsnC family transcriptional regulator [Clostridia bacterium]
MRHLDKIDIQLLKLLQNNARIPVSQIAKEVFVSAPTVATRIEELTEMGIIKGYYTEIDNSAFSNVIKAYIDMEVSPEKKNELYEYLINNPSVMECNRVTGEYSLLIKVVFKNTLEMDKFINTLQVYGRTKTQIVFSTIISHRGVII